ncbi:MAG: type II toxin-antitoxin system Phd/YefM family antitoxin [Gammaproteobacteria bacterium]|nr:type II toxin-antitoxin system Phd/YefM family antitoxin [Gammaproteobacteria bacterium]MBU1724035.1 type II toxin-antitoxin system Phd/YefM family antitoxin [Gammaproteobacteria bacterium]MBU2006896.1 type II toxin-antitoxin system Phd/YefM family antitoxin [Gammaproteobacteria bacterium]
MLRGGSWNNTPRNVRSANRNNNTPDNRNNNIGFRLASAQTSAVAAVDQTAILSLMRLHHGEKPMPPGMLVGRLPNICRWGFFLNFILLSDSNSGLFYGGNMPTRILADTVASISEFKANPMKVMSYDKGNVVAVLNHNEPAFYCIPPTLYEMLMERLDDLELLAKVRERENEPSIKVVLDEL